MELREYVAGRAWGAGNDYFSQLCQILNDGPWLSNESRTDALLPLALVRALDQDESHQFWQSVSAALGHEDPDGTFPSHVRSIVINARYETPAKAEEMLRALAAIFVAATAAISETAP